MIKYVNIFVNVKFCETLLQDFEISNAVIFSCGGPLDLMHWNFSCVDYIKELAMNCTSTAFLYFVNS